MTRRQKLVIAAIALLYVLSGTYSVQSDESAVAYLFGRVVGRDQLPGIHWNPPWPVGRVSVARTATNFIMPIGYRMLPDPTRPAVSDLWLTGDTNIVTIRLTIQYRITSLASFELTHERPAELLRRAGERILTRFLVAEDVDPVLTTRRQELARKVERGVQEILDRARVGIEVQSVTVQEAAPPIEGNVRAAFQGVQSASADRERTIHEARAYGSQVLAEASGQAERLRSEARGLRHRRVTLAQGDAASFLALARAHAEAPAVTETRLYLETLERLLPHIDTYVVQPQQDGKIHLRVLR